MYRAGVASLQHLSQMIRQRTQVCELALDAVRILHTRVVPVVVHRGITIQGCVGVRAWQAGSRRVHNRHGGRD